MNKLVFTQEDVTRLFGQKHKCARNKCNIITQGRPYCPEHARERGANRREYSIIRRALARELCICYDCGAATNGKKIRCDDCSKTVNNDSVLLRRKAKEHGRCIQCYLPAKTGGRCKKHAEENNEAKRISYWSDGERKEKAAAKRERKRAKGECYFCAANAVRGGRCAEHLRRERLARNIMVPPKVLSSWSQFYPEGVDKAATV